MIERQGPSKKELKDKIEAMKNEEQEYRREAFITAYDEYVEMLEAEIEKLKARNHTQTGPE
ncbi:hypothetical protein [Shouchella shacheensis]|uniref:hypothetical protein n=1 Tax=Shouchella shacheensis TaxID=1649580 RepID=UPI00074034B1|nr:hypothetical protein [Shouchella shacheensis]